MNDNSILALKQAKDGQGRYLFPEIRAPQPRHEGYPVNINDQMADAAMGTVPVLFGGFSTFKIRMVAEIRLKVLYERYAELDQTGVIAWVRFDSNHVDAGTHPIQKLTMA